eukprot:671152-Rhodomonas_salina.8
MLLSSTLLDLTRPNVVADPELRFQWGARLELWPGQPISRLVQIAIQQGRTSSPEAFDCLGCRRHLRKRSILSCCSRLRRWIAHSVLGGSVGCDPSIAGCNVRIRGRLGRVCGCGTRGDGAGDRAVGEHEVRTRCAPEAGRQAGLDRSPAACDRARSQRVPAFAVRVELAMPPWAGHHLADNSQPHQSQNTF